MTELVEIWRFREVTLNLVRRNLKVRYKNSLLGFAWSLLNPLMQIGVWWLVFGVIMPKKPEPNFMPFLLSGFLPWLFFSQTVLDSAACVTQEMALVKKAYFPRTILPISSIISNLVHLALAFAVMIILFAIWGPARYSYFWLHIWMVLPATLLVGVFAYGLSAMVAAWSVLYADVKFIVGNLLGLWFFLTPVLYSIGGVLLKDGVMPGQSNWLQAILQKVLPAIKVVYLSDPITISILGYRSGLLLGGENPLLAKPNLAEAPTAAGQQVLIDQAHAATLTMQHNYNFAHYVIMASVIALLTALVGQYIFRKLSPSFAERG